MSREKFDLDEEISSICLKLEANKYAKYNEDFKDLLSLRRLRKSRDLNDEERRKYSKLVLLFDSIYFDLCKNNNYLRYQYIELMNVIIDNY